MARALVLVLAVAACGLPAEKHLVDAEGAPLACLGQPLPTMADPQVTISGTTGDPFTGDPVPGALVEAFLTGSTVPLFKVHSDSKGNFSHDQATGGVPRDAYLQVSAANYLTTTLYPRAPIAHDVQIGAQLVSSADLAQIASIAQISLDPSKAQILMQVVDCNDAPLGGATVSTTPAGTVVYFVNFTPTPSAVMTDNMSGVAFIANVPVSNTTISASLSGMALRSHNFDAIAGGLIQTAVQP